MDGARCLLSLALLHCLVSTVRPSDTFKPLGRGYWDPASARGHRRDRREPRCTLSFQRIEIRKDVELASGRVAVCFGTVTTSICEGQCASYSASSIRDPAGFTKKCTCCREKQLTSQMVVLSPCFDPDDGRLIVGAEFMDEFQQPAYCECQPCAL